MHILKKSRIFAVDFEFAHLKTVIIMRKIVFLFAVLLLAGGIWAQDEEQPVQKLNVHMLNGQIVSFLLDDEPVTTFENGNLVITTNQGQYSYPLAQMKKYTHEGIPDGIDVPTVAPGDILVRQNNEQMLIEGLPDKAQVSVYSVDGKMLFNKQAIGGQPTSIMMSMYPAGNYIINAGGVSFKFVKQ